MSTKINGNQIDAATRAIITALTVTEQINLPSLTQTAINGLQYLPLVYFWFIMQPKTWHRFIFKMLHRVCQVGTT